MFAYLTISLEKQSQDSFCFHVAGCCVGLFNLPLNKQTTQKEQKVNTVNGSQGHPAKATCRAAGGGASRLPGFSDCRWRSRHLQSPAPPPGVGGSPGSAPHGERGSGLGTEVFAQTGGRPCGPRAACPPPASRAPHADPQPGLFPQAASLVPRLARSVPTPCRALSTAGPRSHTSFHSK